MPSRYCQSFCRKSNIGSCWVGGCSGSGRRMPFGRPVVPDEYSIAVPSAFVRDRRVRQTRRRFSQADDALALACAIGDDAEFDLGAFLERLARDVELCH